MVNNKEKILWLLSNMLPELKGYMVRFALDTGIIQGHTDYQRFIILTRSRIGSNMLQSALSSHTNLVVFSEIFGYPDIIFWDYPGYRSKKESKNMLNLRSKDPVKFLDTKIFAKFQGKISAVGFKIFYNHAQNNTWKVVWQYLRNSGDLKIIHLKRQNILKTHLSQKIAEKTGIFRVKYKFSIQDNEPIALDYEECLNAFQQTREWEKSFEELFDKFPILNVKYEELSCNYENTMEKVLEFLGVPYEDLRPTAYKQSNRTLSEMVINYSELKKKFEHTPWIDFFEE